MCVRTIRAFLVLTHEGHEQVHVLKSSLRPRCHVGYESGQLANLEVC